MSRIFLISGLIVLALSCMGQTGYIIRDTVQTNGLEIRNGSAIENAMTCVVEYGNRTESFSPEQLRGYATDRNTIFVSREISIGRQTKQVFLEKLSSGKYTLYYYKNKQGPVLFLEIDSNGVFLPVYTKKDLEAIAGKYFTGCPEVSRIARAVGTGKFAAGQYMEMAGDCKVSPFPYVKFGLAGGVAFRKFFVSSDAPSTVLGNADFKTCIVPVVGLSVDIPITPRHFSLHTELLYDQCSDSTISKPGIETYSVDMTIRSLSLPVLFRYTTRTNIGLFVEAGPMFVYNLENGGTILPTTGDDQMVNTFQPGLAGGIGATSRLYNRFGVAAGVRLDIALSTTQAYYDTRGLGLFLTLFF